MYRVSEEAINAARTKHIGQRKWERGYRPDSGREILRQKLERAIAVEIKLGRLAVVPQQDITY